MNKRTVKIEGGFASTTVLDLTKWLEAKGYSVDAKWNGSAKSTITASKDSHEPEGEE